MRVLIVESTSAGQAATARRLDSIDRVDRDTLDLSIGLADEHSVLDRLSNCEVLILGATLGDRAIPLARQAKAASPAVTVLMFVTHEAYAAEAFRSALSQGTRKVFSQEASLLDIVQELMSIHEEFRSRGTIRPSRVIAVVQAKGGVGATTACAALADVCGQQGQSSILWDLDIETRDLCRSLMVDGDQPALVRKLIQGSNEISRETLRQALMPVSDHVSILPPADLMSASVDLVGRVDSIQAVQSLLALARVTHDNVIVDLAGRMGPAAAAIIREADAVLVMLDDSLLGLSATRFIMPTLQSILRNPDSLYFLCSGVTVPKVELKKHMAQFGIGEEAWSLARIPFDAAAARWPGSGQTLYTLGKKPTRNAFEDIALALGVVDMSQAKLGGATDLPVSKSSHNSFVHAASCFSMLSPLRSLLSRAVN